MLQSHQVAENQELWTQYHKSAFLFFFFFFLIPPEFEYLKLKKTELFFLVLFSVFHFIDCTSYDLLNI